jgi:hypothetical protein
MSLASTNFMVLKLDALDSPRSVSEALALVSARFRTISTLEEVIVEVDEDDLSGDIRRKMESHGWTINAIEQVEESDSGTFSDADDYDSGYNHYDIFDEIYLDDYWRRAGDCITQ